ncbi:CGNR zinc finger domain-containing protein [Nocardioides sp. 1609]|uniref:CGNR zinc finger domain-containing protein n=1 Tax=Nocardioides sp. 1609 TaxID=2508327 RepID=UPI001FD66775|nr:CGNR zinc finger domain-containing protein [Nocardioides sp. 1609]
MSSVDPRPLVGEPLPLDLLNTRWNEDDSAHDLLDRPDGLGIWLTSVGLLGEVPETDETLARLLTTRAALLAIVQAGGYGPAPARDLLNEALSHGRIRRVLGADGPVSVVETDTPGWAAGWRVAEEFLQLLAQKPERIRKCASTACTLHFYDVSKSGARKWCSMTTCGNRTKARNHYARKRRIS